MTNGKKLLGAGIITFLVASVGTMAVATGSEEQESVVAGAEEAPVVEQPPLASDQYVIDVAVAELDAFLVEAQHQAEIAKTQQAQKTQQVASVPTAEPNYDPGDGSRWDQLAQCESGGNWSYGLVSGTFSGGIMFATSTWLSQGGGEFAPYPYMATREQQIVIAERTLASGGWGQWPGCSRKFGWI
jgi:hypothetical protein